MQMFFKSLKLSQKLLLSILSFSIPILMLLYFTSSGINYNINFAHLEIFGNRLLEPLTQLLVLVPQQQRLVTARGGVGSSSNDLSTITNLIQENLERLEKETQSVGSALKVTPFGLKEGGFEGLLPAKIAEQWKVLQSSQTILSQAQLAQQYGYLTQSIRKLIDRVGNTSNLILDPDLDSYYLMNVVVQAMPQAQQRVGEILLFVATKLQTQLTSEEKLKLEVYASLLQDVDLDQIVQGVSTSLREDKNFYGVSPSLQQNLPPVLSTYKASVTKFKQNLIQLVRTGQGNIASIESLTLGEAVLRDGSELSTVGRKELDKLLEQRIRYYQNQLFIYLVLSLGALAISSFFVFQISREIRVRLTNVIAITKEVAQGNLTTHIHVDSHDEIGQLLVAIKYMVQDLNFLIRKTQEFGIQVSSSATGLLATARQQEVVTANQVESTDNVLNSVQEILHLIKKLVHQMDEVASMSDETAEFASHGQSDLVHMEETMQEMENASNNIFTRLQTINQTAKNVTSIVTQITKVADKTNLLSLNAEIEAEKAGEYGRGFAVVASEVRRLANQTAVAAIDIEQMVDQMQLVVSEGMAEMDSFITKVHHGVANISNVSVQLTKIIELVQALSPNFEEVNTAMQNQSESVKTINDLIVELSQGMQQIKNSLQDTYIAIQDLNEMTGTLREQVSRFQVSTSAR
ncbi:methyl-accepting chemotaxis protein [Brasilonema sp. CT11]|nr:methyl-accepting chemotaxis protein [Brasilonema sp. CT11]